MLETNLGLMIEPKSLEDKEEQEIEQAFWIFTVVDHKTLDSELCLVFCKLSEKYKFSDFQAEKKVKKRNNLFGARLLQYLTVLSRYNDSELQGVTKGGEIYKELGAGSIQGGNLPIYTDD